MTALFTVLVLLCLVFAPVAAVGQSARRIAKVGYPSAVPLANDRTFEAFLGGLRDLGYVSGQNIVVEHRHYATDDQMRRILSEFVDQKVDVLFGGVPVRALAAKSLTKDIPIVCASCGDPVGYGLVPSLARPGGNVTGLASLSAELIGKRVELMKAAIPGVARAAIIMVPSNPGTGLTARALDAAGGMLGVAFQRIDVQGVADFESAFRTAAKAGVNAVLVQDDPLTTAARTQIGESAVKYRLPVMTGQPEAADFGVLLAYGPDRRDLYRRAAAFVDKILKGAKPGDLPFEQPTKFELVVSAKTAKALGLTLPPSLLLRADRVIE